MRRLCFFALSFFLLKTVGQNFRTDKNIFLSGGVELGFPIYNNKTLSGYEFCTSMKMYALGFTASARYYLSPLSDFGSINTLFFGIGYCSPLRHLFSGFIELGGSNSWPEHKSETGHRYESVGPSAVIGMNFRPVPEGRFLVTTSLRGFSYDIFYKSVREGGYSITASVGAIYTLY